MRTLIFTSVLVFFSSFISGLGLEPDTVWTHYLWQYKVIGNCVRFMPDGKSIIAGVNNTIYEFDTATGRLMRKFESTANSKITSLSITHDSKKIIAKTQNYNFISWDYYSGKYDGSINYHDSTKNPASNFVIKPKENKVFFLVNDTIVLFNLNSKKVEKLGFLPAKSFHDIAASQDGKYIALTYIYINPYSKIWHSKLYLYDAINWKIIRELDDITRDIHSITFSPSSKYISITTGENEGDFLRIYNLENGTKYIFPRGNFGYYPYNAIFLNNENYLLVSGSNDSLSITKLIRLESGKSIYTINYGGASYTMDINKDNQLTLFDENGSLVLINSNWYKTDVPTTAPEPNLNIKYRANYLFITNPEKLPLNKIQIFDVLGNLIKTIDNPENSISFSAPAGVYLLRVVTDEKDHGFRIVVSE